MKLGVLQFFSWPERRVPLETVFARALDRIEIMDRAGYDAVWLAEHHFSSFSVCPSVHLMGTMAAARTKRLRIGTGVSLAPFYHPLRLAEEVALLDVLSGGRVNWGAGRGFARVEFENFGVPPDESTSRFHEAVEIVLRAWSEERLSFEGQHFRFDGVEVLPKPLQRPHPPVWMAATSEGSIDWAAGQGFSILMDPHSAHQDLGRKRRYYAERLRAAGFSIDGRDLPMARLLALGDTEAEAEEVARRGADGSSIRISVRNTTRSASRTRPRRARTRSSAISTALSSTVRSKSVLDRILRLREEIGLDYLLAAPLSHRSFMLLTEKSCRSCRKGVTPRRRVRPSPASPSTTEQHDRGDTTPHRAPSGRRFRAMGPRRSPRRGNGFWRPLFSSQPDCFQRRRA